MRVTALEVSHFRNLQQVKILPHTELNLILGNNAQGKTNLLEAIWACTGCRSFRGAKEWDYIGLQQPLMETKLHFTDRQREQEIIIRMQREGRQRKIWLNRVPVQGTSKLFSAFQCVIFSPDDREYIRGGPEKRRAFMDLCGSQLNPTMLGCYRRFEQLTAQRNAMLKQVSAGFVSVTDLTDWDIQLAAYGSLLTCMRYAYIQQLSAVCTELYGKITGGKEKLTVSYRSNLFRNSEIPEQPNTEMQAYYRAALQKSVRDDVRLGFTAKGAGRDDFVCKINGLSVKDYGSQGQQKSTALVLKLAQAAVFYEKKEETPVILLDDVMGELDANRRNLVYDTVRNMQVFLTACNGENLCEQNADPIQRAVFYMENGLLRERISYTAETEQ
ncbi:MAG: DNA replication and repair protein RecF [Oscillospiraceae bacterium]|nr:DNA replication and repair protein RecF [Oscillospiraceae bacterium]